MAIHFEVWNRDWRQSKRVLQVQSGTDAPKTIRPEEKLKLVVSEGADITVSSVGQVYIHKHATETDPIPFELKNLDWKGSERVLQVVTADRVYDLGPSERGKFVVGTSSILIKDLEPTPTPLPNVVADQVKLDTSIQIIQAADHALQEAIAKFTPPPEPVPVANTDEANT